MHRESIRIWECRHTYNVLLERCTAQHRRSHVEGSKTWRGCCQCHEGCVTHTHTPTQKTQLLSPREWTGYLDTCKLLSAVDVHTSPLAACLKSVFPCWKKNKNDFFPFNKLPWQELLLTEHCVWKSLAVMISCHENKLPWSHSLISAHLWINHVPGTKHKSALQNSVIIGHYHCC